MPIVTPSAGGVASVTAADTSIVVGGTPDAPTIRTNTLDVIATDHPPAANWSNNAKKITGLANGTLATDAAAFGQIPTTLPASDSLDAIATAHPTAADWSNNSHKITSLANGSAAQDAMAFGQLAPAVGGVAWTNVVKAGDTSRASTTVAAFDPELIFTPANGGVYEFQLFAIYASPAGGGTPDLKWGIGEDGTVRGQFMYPTFTDADATAVVATFCSTSTWTIVTGTAASKRVQMAFGWYLGTGNQTGFAWAQQNSNVNPVIVYTGSVLRYRRIV